MQYTPNQEDSLRNSPRGGFLLLFPVYVKRREEHPIMRFRIQEYVTGGKESQEKRRIKGIVTSSARRPYQI